MPFNKRSHFAIFGLAICGLFASDDKLAAKTELRTETELSTNDVLSVMNDKDWILVDTRATDAYNGWALDGMKRGGHLPHAVDFPASWLDVGHKEKHVKLATALRTKGIGDRHLQHVALQ